MSAETGGFDRRAVRVEVTRTPRRPRRRRRLFGKADLYQVPDLFSSIPVEDPLSLLLMLVVVGILFAFLVFVLPVVVGFAVAVWELAFVAGAWFVGSLWAWLRGHPKVAVLSVGDHRWWREITPGWNGDEDVRMVADGVQPEAIGYLRVL